METHRNTALPQGFVMFIENKLERNGEGGRPHFLHSLAEGYNPQQGLLDIIELTWIKDKPLGRVAKKYNTSYHTIWRLLQDLEPFKTELVSYLHNTPRRKRFYNEELDTSDFETVQLYINRAHRKELRNYVRNIKTAERCWKHLHYKSPENWTADELSAYLKTLPKVMASGMLDAIRQVAPQTADKNSPHFIETGQYRERIGRRKKPLFGKDIKLIHEALDAFDLSFEKTIFDLHVALGAREGSNNAKAGLCGIGFDRFKEGFRKVDLYESKVRGGIWCRDCPVDLIFPHLPAELEKLWIERGKPTTEKLIKNGYKELRDIYKRIRNALKEYWNGKLEPSLYQQLITLRPHDSDKIHCNLLWEAETPLEVVAGEYLGGSEAIGIVGRVWLDINTIKKHYLSLTARSKRIQKIRDRIGKYARQFNGYDTKKADV